MSKYTFRMGDAFPADDPVARWLVTVSIALNDLVFALTGANEAKEDHELSEFFRLACLRLWEVGKFVSETYDDWPEIKEFVDSLPEPAPECFARLKGLINEGHEDYLGAELAQIRNLVAHYQQMNPQTVARPRDPITRSLEEIADEEVTLEISEKVGDLRLGHADAVLARTMMRLMPTPTDQKRVLGGIAERNGDVITFVQLALDTWLRGLPDGTLTSP